LHFLSHANEKGNQQVHLFFTKMPFEVSLACQENSIWCFPNILHFRQKEAGVEVEICVAWYVMLISVVVSKVIGFDSVLNVLQKWF